MAVATERSSLGAHRTMRTVDAVSGARSKFWEML
jgi:hypothetical protein